MRTIALRNVTKRYGAVAAIDGVSIEIRRGEIHAILGENGAGKTTLMRVLCGLARPDAGEILVDGAPAHLRSPRDAARLGIAMVHQHQMLAPRLTVAENLLLALRDERGFFVHAARVRARVSALSERFGLGLDPDATIASLTVGVAQRVEILKALANDASVLILDEPTAVLAPPEVASLLEIMRRSAASGAAVLFVTHKLAEVRAAASRVTVLRRGRVTLEMDVGSETDVETLARAVVGAENAASASHALPSPSRAEVLLSLRDVVDRSRVLERVTLDVHAGEIVGIAGVDGNGQAELARVVAGIEPALEGALTAPPQLALVPGDRTLEGLVGEMPIWENLSIGPHRVREFRRRGILGSLGVLDRAKLRRHAARLATEYDVRAANLDQRAAELSGGNQQKVVLARALATGARVLVAVNPTRGLDVGATRFVHNALVAHRDRGGAVLLISSDLDELLALSDRAGVLFRGALTMLPPAETTLARIGELMVGVTRAASA
jgi:simple sugar transport system ATP-binding protein